VHTQNYSKQFVFFSIFVLLVVSFVPTLNLSGYCFAEKRFFAADEYLSAAIRESIAQYPPKNYGGSQKLVASPITYQSFGDFLSRNSNCCKLVVETDHQYKLSFLDRIMGKAAALVEVNYKVETSTNAGAYTGLSPGMYRQYHVITNCGHAWNGI
jgi:hypothetical protein